MGKIPLEPGCRQALGNRFCEWIRTGNDAISSAVHGWWKDVEKMYRNEMPESPGRNLTPFHWPISQPRQDALTANVCTVIGKQDPVMLCDVDDTDVATRRQQFLHRAWTDAGFDSQLEKASTDATNINKAFFKVTPKDASGTYGAQKPSAPSAKAGLDISVIHPENMVVFPASVSGIDESILCGNKLLKTLGTCKYLIENDYYYKDAHDPAMTTETDSRGALERSQVSLSVSSDPDTTPVELWDCIVEYDLSLIDKDAPAGKKRYRATLAIDTNELMMLEAYPENYRHKWYFDTAYITGGAGYWPARSLGRNLLTLQDACNKLLSVFYTGAFNAAKPPVIGPALGETMTEYKFGQYFESNDLTTPFSPNVRFEGAPIVSLIERIEMEADRVAMVSQNTMGSVPGRANTATTDSIIAAGVAVGIQRYIANFSSCLPAMAEHSEDVLVGMFEDVARFYTRTVKGEDGTEQMVPLVDEAEIKFPTSWRVNGTSPSATPEARMQAGTQLLQMAADPETGLSKFKAVQAILADSPLSGTEGLQMSQSEFEQMKTQQMQEQQAQMQAQAQRPAGIAESFRIQREDLSDEQFAWLLEQQGMPPEIAAMVKSESGAERTGDIGGGTGANPPGDDAVVEQPDASALQRISRTLAARFGAQMHDAQAG